MRLFEWFSNNVRKNFGSFSIPWGQPERRLMKTIWGNYKLALLSISCMLNAALSGSFIVVETEGWRRQLADGRTSSIISWLSKQRQSEWPHSRERHYCQFHHIFHCVISTKKCTFHSIPQWREWHYFVPKSCPSVLKSPFNRFNDL